MSLKIMEWRGISLQPLSESTISLIHSWRNSTVFLSNLTSRSSVTYNEFLSELERDFASDRHIQFIIIFCGKPVGTIYSYSNNSLDKYCFFSIFTEETFHFSGKGIIASIIFCRFLFESHNLFKIYFDIYEYNESLIALLTKRKIEVEGCFKKQHIFRGHRYDVLRFAIYEENLSSWLSRYKEN